MKNPKKKVSTYRFCFTLKDDGTYSVRMRKPFNLYFIVKVPKSIKGLPVTEIEANAFMFSTHLRKVIIPASIKKIGFSPFLFCPKGLKVAFKGTVAQWEAVEKENENKVWNSYPVYCRDATREEISENTISEEERKLFQELLKRVEENNKLSSAEK